MELDLLHKTELWINGIELTKANLNTIADTVAHVLELPRKDVLVVDVRNDVVVLDILSRKIQAEQIMGKEKELLLALSGVSGVRVTSKTDIHANGILGLIGVKPELRDEIIEQTVRISEQVKEGVAKRGMVFSSGREVEEGIIEDTNSPYLIKLFSDNGYRMRFGGILSDDLDMITGRLRAAAADGYGLVITTGGVGAEDKDFMVESVCRLDQQANTPCILQFHAGEGRHVKNSVRIAVGKIDLTTIVTLPGPHDEVRLVAPVLLDGLKKGLDKKCLANVVATTLQEKWRKSMTHR